MKTFKKSLLAASVSLIALSSTSALAAVDVGIGKVSGDFNLRYEGVEQDNAAKDATAVTLRSRITLATKEASGFSAVVGVENVTHIVDDFNGAGLDGDPAYSVVADPEVTELDQGFVQYKNKSVTAKVGRQVITLDGHRFVGHVGWRQDRQTFDAASVNFSSGDLSAYGAYITKRNRIFADDRDIDAKDVLLNLSYKTPVGKLTGYSYLLEEDDSGTTIDTYGISLNGSKDLSGTKAIYGAEFATQERGDLDTTYMSITGGAVVNGVTLKANYEVLGSDDGAGAFITPLATLHKFNGWADQFLGTPAVGLTDLNFTVSTKALGGKVVGMYHVYDSDEGSVDFGDELNLLYATKFNKTFSGGVKYAMYSAGDDASGKVDTDKLWVWVGAKF